MRDLAVERIEAEPLLESRDLRSFDLKPGIDHVFSLPGRPGSRTLGGRYPADARIDQQPRFEEVSTAPRTGNVQRNFRCRRSATSSSSSATSASSYSFEYQLPLEDSRVLGKSNSLRINRFQIPPAERHLRRPQIGPCSSSSDSSMFLGQGVIGNAENDKTAARQILTRFLSLWPLQILNEDAPRSDDDLLLAEWRKQVMTSSRSPVKDVIEHPRKRNCETKYKKDCLLRRVAPRKTSTVDPMLMMVGIGRK